MLEKDGAALARCRRAGKCALRRCAARTRATRLTGRVSRPFGFLLAPEPPPRRVGVVVAVAAVALCTLIIYPLKEVAPVVSLGVVYVPAVLVVSVTWGAPLGVATAVLSALAYNFFHLPPVGQFDDPELEQLGCAGGVPGCGGAGELRWRAGDARCARDAESRRVEADLAAEMARLLLRGNSLADALPRPRRAWRARSSCARLRSSWRRWKETSAALRSRCVKGRPDWARCWLRRTPRRRACAGCRSAWCRRLRRS